MQACEQSWLPDHPRPARAKKLSVYPLNKSKPGCTGLLNFNDDETRRKTMPPLPHALRMQGGFHHAMPVQRRETERRRAALSAGALRRLSVRQLHEGIEIGISPSALQTPAQAVAPHELMPRLVDIDREGHIQIGFPRVGIGRIRLQLRLMF
jgi:hypothetical protein